MSKGCRQQAALRERSAPVKTVYVGSVRTTPTSVPQLRVTVCTPMMVYACARTCARACACVHARDRHIDRQTDADRDTPRGIAREHKIVELFYFFCI